jgi:hypothetical protein
LSSLCGFDHGWEKLHIAFTEDGSWADGAGEEGLA